MIDALDAGFRAAEQDGLPPVGLCVSLLRTQSADAAADPVDTLIALGHLRVVALSIDGNETAAGRTGPRFAKASRRAGEAGLKRTVHAGESSGPRACATRSSCSAPIASTTACARSKTRRSSPCSPSGSFRWVCAQAQSWCAASTRRLRRTQLSGCAAPARRCRSTPTPRPCLGPALKATTRCAVKPLHGRVRMSAPLRAHPSTPELPFMQTEQTRHRALKHRTFGVGQRVQGPAHPLCERLSIACGRPPERGLQCGVNGRVGAVDRAAQPVRGKRYRGKLGVEADACAEESVMGRDVEQHGCGYQQRLFGRRRHGQCQHRRGLFVGLCGWRGRGQRATARGQRDDHCNHRDQIRHGRELRRAAGRVAGGGQERHHLLPELQHSVPPYVWRQWRALPDGCGAANATCSGRPVQGSHPRCQEPDAVSTALPPALVARLPALPRRQRRRRVDCRLNFRTLCIGSIHLFHALDY